MFYAAVTQRIIHIYHVLMQQHYFFLSLPSPVQIETNRPCETGQIPPDMHNESTVQATREKPLPNSVPVSFTLW